MLVALTLPQRDRVSSVCQSIQALSFFSTILPRPAWVLQSRRRFLSEAMWVAPPWTGQKRGENCMRTIASPTITQGRRKNHG